MISKRLKIGIDIDGVLIDMDPKKYLEFCTKEFGWDTNYETYVRTHSWLQATGQTDQALRSRAWEQYIQQVDDVQLPIEGAHGVLRELGKTHDIYLITARSSNQLEITEEILQKHLPDVQYTELSMGNKQGKIQPMIDFGIDYYIDDSYEEIVSILQNKEIATKIIPFPSFHITKGWDGLNDDRLIWLSVWDFIEQYPDSIKRKIIYQKSWEEIKDIILMG